MGEVASTSLGRWFCGAQRLQCSGYLDVQHAVDSGLCFRGRGFLFGVSGLLGGFELGWFWENSFLDVFVLSIFCPHSHSEWRGPRYKLGLGVSDASEYSQGSVPKQALRLLVQCHQEWGQKSTLECHGGGCLDVCVT